MLWMYLMVCTILISGFQAQHLQKFGEWKDLASLVEKRCIQNTEDSETALNFLMKSLNGFGRCLQEGKTRIRNDEDVRQFHLRVKWCTEFPEVNYHCFEDILNKLDPCLEPEEKFFPNFFLSSYNTSFELLCKDGIENAAEFIVKSFELNCKDTPEHMWTTASRNCVSQLNFTKDSSSTDFILYKSDVRGYFTDAKDCFVGSLDAQCSKDNYFARLVEIFFHAYISWKDE